MTFSPVQENVCASFWYQHHSFVKSLCFIPQDLFSWIEVSMLASLHRKLRESRLLLRSISSSCSLSD